MSYNYLETSFFDIPELESSRIEILNNFTDFHLLENYKHITIGEWNHDYPLEIPNGVIALSILCEYPFPLNNLPSSLEVLYFQCMPDGIIFPLENLPNNLYQLEFYTRYEHPLTFLPESIRILKFHYGYAGLFNMLPRGLKELKISNYGFSNDEIITWPPNLEKLDIIQCFFEGQDTKWKFESQLNLLELPVSLRVLHLTSMPINNIEEVLARLNNLEELYVKNIYSKNIMLYPPNLKKFYMKSTRIIYDYPDELLIPPNLIHLEINEWFDGTIDLANSNLEYLVLYGNEKISILNQIPKSLKKLDIPYSHSEVSSIKRQYPHLELIDSYNAYLDDDNPID